MKDVLMCQDDLLRLRVALVDDPLDLAVDIGSNTLTCLLYTSDAADE